jgi:hypothetical protein
MRTCAVPGRARHRGDDKRAMLRHAWCVTRSGLILFGAAMIGVPIATVVFLAASASGADEALLRVWFPAGIGVTLGAGMLVLRPSWRPTLGGPSARADLTNDVGPIASTLITAGALIGWFSDLLPIEIVAFSNGFAFGLFAALDVAVVSLWRKDSAFRERVRAAFAAFS